MLHFGIKNGGQTKIKGGGGIAKESHFKTLVVDYRAE